MKVYISMRYNNKFRGTIRKAAAADVVFVVFQFLLLVLFLVLQVAVLTTLAFEECNCNNNNTRMNNDDGDDGEEAASGLLFFCPTGNTCCCIVAAADDDDNDHVTTTITTTSFCIPNDLGSYNATCCNDDGGGFLGRRRTGCGVGYTCGGAPKNSNNNTCIASKDNQDPLVQILPRYQLCHLKNTNGKPPLLYGFPTGSSSGIINDDNHERRGSSSSNLTAKLAYYSSHGNIETTSLDKIRMVLVVIHGANRNADDYYCTATVAAEQQSSFPLDSVLVVAPKFASMSDSAINLANGGIAMRWEDGAGNGPWRYGANAVYPFHPNDDDDDASSLSSIEYSSYHALDRLIQYIVTKTASFKNNLLLLKRVAVIGHSSGGQFVQRWSMLTPIWDDDDDDDDGDGHTSNPSRRINFVGVVANPSSYAYLTPLRYVQHRWQVPPTNIDGGCPDYNKWQWGFDVGGNYSVGYVSTMMDSLGSLGNLTRRFIGRRVVYMAGSQDRCNVSDDDTRNGWCYSHGLETKTCMDQLQGTNRWERHNNYLTSLRMLNFSSNIHHRTVPSVGHDHSLMFNSREGLESIFEL